MEQPKAKPKLLQRPKSSGAGATHAPAAVEPKTPTAKTAEDKDASNANAASVTNTSGPILGTVQLLKRQPATAPTSQESSNTSSAGGESGDVNVISAPAPTRSNQASPIPSLMQEKDVSTTPAPGAVNKPISGILERPKATPGAAPATTANALDSLRPYSSPIEHAVPLIDSSLRMLPDSTSFRHLLEENKNTKDFFVVCAIGPPSSGKSAVLSYLANSKQTKFMPSNKNDLIFPPRANNENQECAFYVSTNRTIFIELAPVFSSSTAVNFVGLVQQFGTIEAATVTWNLRLMRWALSVSHLVLLCSDGMVDPNLIQLVNAAEMIQPVESAFGEGVYPEIVLVCNKVPLTSFYAWTEPGVSKTQTKWNNLYRQLTGKTPRITPNVLLLPHNKNNFGFEEYRFEALRKILDQWDRYNRAPFIPDVEGKAKIPQAITIPEWSQIAAKYWEEMQLQSFFSSYLQSYLKSFP
jgi:hypothetical protein